MQFQFKNVGDIDMSKMKTIRGAAKRFKRTKRGFKFKRAFKNHILSKMSSKRKRQLRGLRMVAKSDVKSVEHMLRDK